VVIELLQRLEDRMKLYENSNNLVLPKNMPLILRVDGRAFHTLTKKLDKPFDIRIMDMMNQVAQDLCKEIMNARIAYVQSDEISILIYNHILSDVWFGNKQQKMTSISASVATLSASKILDNYGINYDNKLSFDSRVFLIPEKDVNNYFIWRQRDWERNSLQMLTRSYYTHKEVDGKNHVQMHDMIHTAGDNWDNLPTEYKRGRCCVYDYGNGKWSIDNEIPIFAQQHEYIEKYLDIKLLEEMHERKKARAKELQILQKQIENDEHLLPKV
jgi:tRNA(His) 5'-end guanylyltransferase